MTLIAPSTTSIPFSRDYIYECVGENEASVLFGDRSPFHSLKFEDGEARPGLHNCGKDVYEGRIVLLEKGMRHEWKVEGPEKAYTICTDFTRKADDVVG
jgi:hypothetical protein